MAEGDNEKGFLKDFLGRFSHPVLGAFSFYWLIFNWDAVYLLIHGGDTYKETIQTLWTVHFVKANHLRLFTYPAVLTLAYLLFGSFFADMFKQIPKWTEALWNKLVPVPAYEVENLRNKLQVAAADKNFHVEAYNVVSNSADPQQQLVNYFRQVRQYNNQLEEARKEIAMLKANKVVSGLGIEVGLIKKENIEMKEQKEKIVQLTNLLTSIMGKYSRTFKKAVDKLDENGDFDEVADVGEMLVELSQLEELIEKGGIAGLKKSVANN